MDKSAWKRYSRAGFRHWDQTCLGYKYNMTDIQASLGLCQLRKIDRFWVKRKRYVDLYDELLGKEDELILLPPADRTSKCAFDLYPVRVMTELLSVGRDDIIDMIQSYRIGIGVHFRAVHLLSFYKKYFQYRRGIFPNAEYASDRLISLPLYPKMAESDVRYVARTVSGILAKFRRRR
jgi:dTDP-4-amino-4,6-dideoxygalactose transaminase